MSESKPSADYARPNQLWRCGRTGCCPLGPTAWGRCRETPGCRPRLSLRGLRGVFVASLFFATLGTLLLVMYSPWRNRLLKPGELSSPHAQALSHLSADQQCASCHDAAEVDPIAWLKIASGNLASLGDTQATRCLVCHERSFGGDAARFAHNLPPEHLAEITVRRNELVFSGGQLTLSSLAAHAIGSDGKVACSTCHREHHGANANLSELTDRQCQSCHVGAFDSFEHGHPEFRNPLPSRRNRVAFDHVAHAQKHFPGREHEFRCNQCHVDDPRGEVKRLAGFEQSCAACHSQPIQAASLEGMVAFSLPILNVEELRQSGHDIGHWPEPGQGDFDGDIPPLLRLLLSADDQAAAALERLGASFDYSQTTPQRYDAVADLAWSYKRLLNDLANDTPGTLTTRLSKVGRGRVSAAQIEQAIRQAPPGLFAAARRRWFPDLHGDLSERSTPPLQTAVYPRLQPTETQSELLAENPLAKSRSASHDAIPGITWWNEPQSTPPAAARSLELPTENARLEKPAASPDSNPGELLAENPLSKIKTIKSDSALLDVPAVAPQTTANDSAMLDKPAALSAQARQPDPLVLVSSGAWYLDDATLSIRYRSRGHADELLALMLDVAAAASHPLAADAGPLLPALRNLALSSCTSCHSIDAKNDHYAINWQASYRDASRKQFTWFSHRPHTLQPRLADCSHCHTLREESQVLANYRSTETHAHAHDFAPLTKANCVGCHTATQAGSRCTQCHSYHVGGSR
jgi:hypothetical protein